jgi:hypothetical protein
MMATVEGKRVYAVVEGWEHLPAGFTHDDVVGIGIDSGDRVYLLTRGPARVIVYERDGAFVGSWGEGLFTERTHGLTIGPDDTVHVVDEGNEVVYVCSTDGQVRQTIGTPGVASDTGYDGSLASIVRGGPPFNRPTNLAVAPTGDLYVTDGYGNARVHRFAPDGTLIQSWGEPGAGPGQFNLPHGIAITADGLVLVADRENDRVQHFTLDGQYLTEWTDIQRPTNVAIGPDGLFYVSELWWRVGQTSMRHGEITVSRPGRVSVLDRQGGVVARWGGPEPCAPGSFCAPHDIAVDSRGDVYVGEVTGTFGVRPGLVPSDCHTFQKFTAR